MATNADKLARGWWVKRMERDDDGSWVVDVQLRDGGQLQLLLEHSRDLDHVIAAGVEAKLRGDRRWTARSDRGGS